MLLTAMGEDYENVLGPNEYFNVPTPVTIDALVVLTGDSHKSYAYFGDTEISAKYTAEAAIFCCLSLMIDTYQCDPLDVLASRLARIETRLSEEHNAK